MEDEFAAVETPACTKESKELTPAVTVDEVMQEFRKLPCEEQREVFEVLRAKFANEPSPEQIAEFEQRAEQLRRNPETGIPWERVRAELKDRLEARRAWPAK